MSGARLNCCKACGCAAPVLGKIEGWSYPVSYTCPDCGESTLHYRNEEQARNAWNKKNERSPMYVAETA